MTTAIVRAGVAAAVVLGLGAAAGCSSDHAQTMVTSESDEYRGLVWLGDSVYYLAGGRDSGSWTSLMRVRAGGHPELVTAEDPGCRNVDGGPASPSDIATVGDHELGLFLRCSAQVDGISASETFLRWDADSGSVISVTKIDHDSGGAAWSDDSDTVYFRSTSCPQDRLSAAGGHPSTCLGGPDAVWPAIAADGSVIYFTSRCGTDAPEPNSTYALCRRDTAGQERTLGRGVVAPAALSIRGNRIVFAGQVRGDSGVWLVAGGRFQRLTGDSGDYGGAALNADGTRLAFAVGADDWWSRNMSTPTWSLRVMAMPDA